MTTLFVKCLLFRFSSNSSNDLGLVISSSVAKKVCCSLSCFVFTFYVVYVATMISEWSYTYKCRSLYQQTTFNRRSPVGVQLNWLHARLSVEPTPLVNGQLLVRLPNDVILQILVRVLTLLVPHVAEHIDHPDQANHKPGTKSRDEIQVRINNSKLG